MILNAYNNIYHFRVYDEILFLHTYQQKHANANVKIEHFDMFL